MCTSRLGYLMQFNIMPAAQFVPDSVRPTLLLIDEYSNTYHYVCSTQRILCCSQWDQATVLIIKM